MTYLDILAPTLGRPDDEIALLAAAKIAATVGARAEALFAVADPGAEFVWAGEGFVAPPSPQAIEAAREIQEAAGQRAANLAKAAGEKAGLAGGMPCLTRQDSASRAIVEWSALVDLIVFPADAAKGGSPFAAAFEAALLRARAPILLARSTDILGKPVVIGWDGGVEVGRAVRAALPILKRAQSVTIAQVTSALGDRARAGVDPELLQARLAAAGIPAKVALIAPAGKTPAEALLGAAAGAGLLISGAYAHSRAQEMIFGGATRSFLSGEGPSLFLSH
jgi:nucleotide-binding universal stress UspA family protein